MKNGWKIAGFAVGLLSLGLSLVMELIQEKSMTRLVDDRIDERLGLK